MSTAEKGGLIFGRIGNYNTLHCSCQLYIYMYSYWAIIHLVCVIIPHACARGKVIDLVTSEWLISTVYLSISSKTGFIMFRIVTQGPRMSPRHKYCILLATPINTTHHVLSAHAHNNNVGKGCQQPCIAIELELSHIDAAVHRVYMCSIEL